MSSSLIHVGEKKLAEDVFFGSVSLITQMFVMLNNSALLSVCLLFQMGPDSRPCFSEVVAELEGRESDERQTEHVESDVQGESDK